MTEVGSAYVRLRPDFTGFKAETEAGVGSAFSGVGKLVGAAFAAAGAFHFGKEAISGAADLQKQAEAIKEEFGAAAGSVLDFGKNAAAGLNISEHAADAASAKLGLFLDNLGIAPEQAAKMTIELEKTAGALGQIKNIDPSQILQGFTAGLRGQGRGLAQYGIVLDQTQIKLEALNLGLIKNIKEPLTAAEKAQASFALITAHLPQLLDNAKSHSGDFATVMTHLKVQFQNFIEELGTRVLPFFTKLIVAVSGALPTAFHVLDQIFNAVGSTIQSLLAPFGGVQGAFDKLTSAAKSLYEWAQKILGPLGGAKAAIVGLLGVLAIEKIVGFASAIKDKLAQGALGSLQQSAQDASDSVKTATTEIQTSSETTQTALTDIAAAGDKVLTGLQAKIQGISDTLAGLAGTATASVAKINALKVNPAGGGLAGGVSAAEAGPTAAIASGFAEADIQRAGGALGETFATLKEQTKQVGDQIKEGFDSAAVEEYGTHVHEVIGEFDKAGEAFKKGFSGDTVANATTGLTDLKVEAGTTGKSVADIGAAGKAAGAGVVEGAAEASAGLKALQVSVGTVSLGIEEAGVKAKAALAGFRESVAATAETLKAAFTQIAIFALIIGLTELYNRNQKFHDSVNKLAEDIKSKLVPVIKDLYDRLKQPVGDAFKAIGDFIVAAIPKVEAFAKVLEKLPYDVKAVAAAFGGLFLLLGTASDAFVLTGPIAALAGLGIAFVLAYKHSEEFRHIVKEGISDVKIIFHGVEEAVKNFIDGFKLLPHWGQVAIEVFAGLTAAAIAFDIALSANPVGVVILALAALSIGLIEAYKHFAAVREAAHLLGDGFKIVAATIKNFITGVIEEVKGFVQVFRGIFEVLEGVLTLNWRKVWQGLGDIVKGEGKIVVGAFKAWSAGILAVMDALWKNIEIAFLEGLKKVADLLAKIPTSITIFGHKFGVDNPFKGFGEDLDKEIAHLQGKTQATGQKLAGVVVAPINQAGAIIKQKLAQAKADRKAGLAAAAGAGPAGTDAADRGDQKKINDQIAADAKAYADSIKAAATVINNQLTKTNNDTDATIKKYREQLATLKTDLTAALKQQTDDVANAVQSAKSNLESIASTFTSDIGAVLDKPLQDAQNKITTAQNKLSLTQLRQSVVLPGGKQLDADPKKALAQLAELQRNGSATNKQAIADFIIKYRSALLAVQQDQTNQIKTAAQRRISDLTYSFEHGKISSKQFTAGLVAELKRDHVSFKTAGKELGTAFAGGFADAFNAAKLQAHAIDQAKKGGINFGGSSFNIVKPLDTLHKDQLAVQKIQRQIGDKQTQIQTRIDANTKRSADLLAQLHALQKQLGQTSAAKAPGVQAKTSTVLTGVTH